MEVISRKDWGAARAHSAQVKMPGPATTTYIHHTVTPGGIRTKSGERKHMRELQQIAFSRKFADISYSFVIFRSGRVYRGRGWRVVGAHTEGSNSTSHAFSFVGNFESDRPTKKALKAAATLHRRGVELGHITRAADIRGHQDAPGASTACPGRNLTAQIPFIKKEAR